MNSNLAKRILFVLWAAPLSWVIINVNVDLLAFLPETLHKNISALTPITVLVILITGLAVHEYTQMLSKEFPENKFPLIQFWLIPALFNEAIVNDAVKLQTREHIFLLILVVAAEVVFFSKGKNRWRRASMLFSGVMFFYLAGIFMFQFFDERFVSLWKSFDSFWLNNIGVILTVIAVFMCDSMAYFAGRAFGKHKLSSISPKKTVEGSIGGLLASVVIMTVSLHFLGADGGSPFLGPLLGLSIGVAAQVGDLSVSLIKRYFDVKDSSNLIPGHGGILDRFDSLLFSAPVIHLVISLTLKFGS